MLWSSATSGTSGEIPLHTIDKHLIATGIALSGPVIGVMAKQPIVGLVKTRLTPPLLPDQSRMLYHVALNETVARLKTVSAALAICYAGRKEWFSRTFPGLPLLAQGAGDLGCRLAKTTAELFASGGGPVAMVGADSPDLPIALVNTAFSALATADVAAIACQDGGYALLALRQPTPELFMNIPWSTSEVLSLTRQRTADLGLRFATVGDWDDIDDLPALKRLLVRSPHCMTAQYARVHLNSVLSFGCG